MNRIKSPLNDEKWSETNPTAYAGVRNYADQDTEGRTK